MSLLSARSCQATVFPFLWALALTSVGLADNSTTRQDKAGSSSKPKNEKSRQFYFTYNATLTELAPGKKARIWMPIPPANDDQDVDIVRDALPGKKQIGNEPKFGNRIIYVEGTANSEGKIPVSVTYRINRREVNGDHDGRSQTEKLALYLQPDSKVPVDGKPLELIRDKKLPEDPLETARVLYDVVNGHMRYSKQGTGWGQGDSVWACESRYGNCSDFHSLFISLARSQKIPAKFEIGFPLPSKRGAGEIAGYHCWAKFLPAGHNWVPVDISEANKNPAMKDYYFGNLTEDRVAFSTGRDIDLVPKQDAAPLNFFVYPYAEVDGRPYPDAKIVRSFRYEDLPNDKVKEPAK
jgi:transglutaminase-like putative cysteine protease